MCIFLQKEVNMLFFTDQYVREERENPGIHIRRLKEKLRDNGFSYQEFHSDDVDNSEKPHGSSGMFFALIGDERPPQGETHVVFSRDYIAPLVNELRSNPKSSFKTIYNDLIIKDGYTPKFFSAAVKDCHGQDRGITSEIFGSKMANLLGVPTNYAFGIKYNDGKEHVYPNGKVVNYFAVASIDYASQDHDIEMLCDIDVFQTIHKDELHTKQYHNLIKRLGFSRARDDSSLDNWVKYVDSTLKNRYPNGVNQECYRQFMRDFIKSYLFRVILLRDEDFACYNCGIISQKDSDQFSMLPNTDMEGLMSCLDAYGTDSFNKSIQRKIKKAVNYCRENFPDVLEEFITTLDEVVGSKRLNDSIEEVYGKTKGSQAIKDNINSDMHYMINCYRQPKRTILSYIKDKCSSSEMEI